MRRSRERSRPVRRRSASWRILRDVLFVGLVGIPCLTLALVSAAHYPYFPWLMCIGVVLWTALCAWRPSEGLAILLAALPVIGFAPWTGWLLVEELDLGLAGLACGGYLARAMATLRFSEPAAADDSSRAGQSRSAWRLATDIDMPRFGWLAGFLIVAFAVSTVVSSTRGLADADVTPWQWAQGYFEPLNSIRLAKPFLWAAALAPLIGHLYRRESESFVRLIMQAMTAGLLACSLAALWERVAFPGLTNFSSDYRTTALFWEMHVGGAALDGYLALTIPFALWLAMHATRRLELAFATSALLLGSYAALTTFSRGVFLAVPVSLLAMGALRLPEQFAQGWRRSTHGLVSGTACLVIVLIASWLAFRHGGYRTLGATGSVIAALAFSGAAWRAYGRYYNLVWLGAGLAFGLAMDALGASLPKGAYALHLLATALFGLGWLAHTGYPRRLTAGWMALAIGWMMVCTPRIGLYWAGPDALQDAIWAMVLCLGLGAANLVFKAPLWSTQPRALVLSLGVSASLAASVAVLFGGAYMTDRFSTSGQDLQGRMTHWRDGLSLLETPADLTLGRGLGRFPATYFNHLPAGNLTGTYQWRADGDDNGYLELTSPTYPTSWGDLLRVSQRVAPSPGPYQVSLEVRHTGEISIHVEVCEKHLLYNAACAIKQVKSAPTNGEWRRLSIPLDGQSLTGGPWYAPRLAMFSLAVASRGQRVDVDNVALRTPLREQALLNPGLDRGMDGWFSSSDRHHLPWHIKSLPMHVLFDQGIVGLALFSVLCLYAAIRLGLGPARRHPGAQALVAGAVGFLTVGAFDSLLDVPRTSWAFYAVLTLALLLRPRSGDHDRLVKN